MKSVRRAAHCGSWYTDNGNLLISFIEHMSNSKRHNYCENTSINLRTICLSINFSYKLM